MFKKGKNFLRLESQLCAAKPRQKAFLMVALRHTIKGGAPRLARNTVLEWMQWKHTITQTQTSDIHTPLCFHCDHWKASLLQGNKSIIKKNNYK